MKTMTHDFFETSFQLSSTPKASRAQSAGFDLSFHKKRFCQANSKMLNQTLGKSAISKADKKKMLLGRLHKRKNNMRFFENEGRRSPRGKNSSLANQTLKAESINSLLFDK